MDWLSSLPTGQITAGALVALIVLLILRGNLVPRQQLLDAREDRDQWRKSSEDLLRAYHELGMAVDKLTAQGEATNHALTEIQQELSRAWERPS